VMHERLRVKPNLQRRPQMLEMPWDLKLKLQKRPQILEMPGDLEHLLRKATNRWIHPKREAMWDRNSKAVGASHIMRCVPWSPDIGVTVFALYFSLASVCSFLTILFPFGVGMLLTLYM
jgi:hypothetical protein